MSNKDSFSKENGTIPKIGGCYSFFKRLFDIVAASCGLLLMLVPSVFIALAIKGDSKGPILFRQERMGRSGKTFTCYKFRSMHIFAPKNCSAQGLTDRARMVTSVGSFLRKTSLDEIPQLINVLKGDMSLIGPRPLILREKWINAERLRLGVYQLRPGMTGLAQISGRNNVSDGEKLQYDIEYLRNFSFLLDIKILLKTTGYVIFEKDIL